MSSTLRVPTIYRELGSLEKESSASGNKALAIIGAIGIVCCSLSALYFKGKFVNASQEIAVTNIEYERALANKANNIGNWQSKMTSLEGSYAAQCATYTKSDLQFKSSVCGLFGSALITAIGIGVAAD